MAAPKHSARSSCPQMGTVSWGACPCPKPSAPERITFPFMPWASAGPPIASPSARSPRSPAGAFFGNYNTQVYESILKKLGRQAVARFVRLTVTLPEQIIFESAFEPAQVQRGAKGATVLEWNLPVVVAGETRTVSFQIGARQSGPYSPPKVLIEYRDPKNKLQKESIPTVTLTVNKINKPPVAAFRFVPETPKINERVCFDARESRDSDGKIVQYAWDFDGDGTFDESVTEPQICRVFESVGNFNVTLRVTDEDGATAEFTKTVTIIGVGQMSQRSPGRSLRSPLRRRTAGEP
jgi:hypothetical protein